VPVLGPEVQQEPMAQSPLVWHAPPIRAVPLHEPAAQLPEAQSEGLEQGVPLGAPAEGTHFPDVHRFE